jgi:leucyl aminopeptidase
LPVASCTSLHYTGWHCTDKLREGVRIDRFDARSVRTSRRINAMRFTFAEPKAVSDGLVIVAVAAGGDLGKRGAELDKACHSAITRAIKASDFQGKSGQSLSVVAPTGLEKVRIALLGVGDPTKLDAGKRRAFGATVYKTINAHRASDAVFLYEEFRGVSGTPADRVADIAYGARLRSYRFDKYLTREAEDKKPTARRLTIQVRKSASARAAFAPLTAIADGVDFARDLVSEPSNVKYPRMMASACRSLSKLGVKVEVFGEAQMKKLGMNALLGVGQGSVRESQMVVMHWNGGARGAKPVALIGKGVTFDTGGISIKPAAGMEDMIWDMGGAGAVIGAMHAIAGRKASTNVVGLVGLVENMPDGNAQRPGDIVVSMSGQTIEVINTDAEGRLVLADVMHYAQKKLKPELMIDLATLTGAIIVALGHENAGLYANDDELAERLRAAGAAVGEPVWRMPLGEGYDKLINSPRADMKNVGPRWGGSITAAQFLQRFADDIKWAHLDIAGVAWADKELPVMDRGATAFGVRLLDRFVADNYEK